MRVYSIRRVNQSHIMDPLEVIKDRKRVLDKIGEDLESMSPEEFVVHFKSKRSVYEGLPYEGTKRKRIRKGGPPKLTTASAWSLFVKDHIATEKESRGKLTFDDLGEIRRDAADEW